MSSDLDILPDRPPGAGVTPSAARLWRRTKQLTAVLLLLWILVNLVSTWFARELNQLHVADFPLGYWMAAQGALLLYLAIVLVYDRSMRRMESQCLAEEDIARSVAASQPRSAGERRPPPP